MNSLTKEQKTGFVLLFIFALLTIAMGVLQMRNNIYNPYVLKSDKKTATAQAVVVDETAKLQAIDTDQDGLNNYEELFFYQTSPYLPDTDSDGMKDREEVVAGKDPLCPEGKKCEDAAEATVITSSTLVTSPISSSTAPLDILNEAGFVKPQEANSPTIQEYFNNPEKIRELLRQSGEMTESEINQINDATLLEVAKSIVEGQSKTVPSSNSFVTTSQP